MDITQCIESATRAGILREALPDALNRATSHFAGMEPPLEDLDTYYATTLRSLAPHFWPTAPTPRPTPRSTLEEVAARHGMPLALWESLSPEERYTRERVWKAQHGQASVPKRRPQPVTLRPEQVAELAKLEPMARLSAYRELQAQQKG